MSKLVWQISFWWFFTQRRKTLWSSNWNWWRPNQSNNRFGSSQYNSWDCREASCITYMHWKPLKTRLCSKTRYSVPHELKEKHLTQRINSCDLLKKRNENDPFLKRLIIGDEKWVIYNNISGKDRGGGYVNQLKQHQKLVFIERRFCYQFGGITKELSILNSYHPTERSILSSTLNN